MSAGEMVSNGAHPGLAWEVRFKSSIPDPKAKTAPRLGEQVVIGERSGVVDIPLRAGVDGGADEVTLLGCTGLAAQGFHFCLKDGLAGSIFAVEVSGDLNNPLNSVYHQKPLSEKDKRTCLQLDYSARGVPS